MNGTSVLLITRCIRKIVRQPSAPLSGLGMSVFFLFVYDAGIGGIEKLPEFGNAGYLAFLFPLTLVSLSMGSAAGSGQTLFADLQSGYFKRLYLSPIPRWAFVIAPLVADGISTLAMTSVLLALGLLAGVPLQFGFLSILGVFAFSLLWSTTLSGFAAGVMLRSGNHQSAQIVTTAVFPLLFLSTTFLPRELIASEWLLAVSWGNPVTYVLEGVRFLLGGTSGSTFFIYGISIVSASALAALFFALNGAKKILV